MRISVFATMSVIINLGLATLVHADDFSDPTDESQARIASTN